MSTKKWKDSELKGLLTEKWGFKMDLRKLNEEVADEEELDEGCPGAEPMPMGGEIEVVDDMAVAEEPGSLINHIKDLLSQLEGSMGAAPIDEPMMDEPPMMEGEDEELEERRGRGRDREGMEADPRRRPMQEAVVRQRIRKILKNVKFKKQETNNENDS